MIKKRRFMTILIVPTVISIFFCTSLSIANEGKKIVYLTGCRDAEITSDIETSIEGITDFLKKNEIKLVKQRNSRKCGYILIMNTKKKFIESALTDVDLIEMSEEFFKIDK